MKSMEGLRQHMNLKDMLQVRIKPLQQQIQICQQKDTIIPVMIDIRTLQDKCDQQHESEKNILDGDLTKSCTPSSQTSNNLGEIDRQPLDLIFVIDLSISMRGKKMAQLRKTISNLMNFLTENDRMAIIGFNNSAQNLFPLQYLNQQNKKKIALILNSILPMGLTNITAGLLEGIKQIESSILNFSIAEEGEEDEQIDNHHKISGQKFGCHKDIGNHENQEKFRDLLSKSEAIGNYQNKDNDLANSCINFGQKKDDRVKSIFLLSDGLDDRCEKNLEMLRQRIQQMNIQFSLNTFGYGEQHDAFLMNEIAGFKEGNFYFIEDIDKTDLYFADALGGLFSVVGNSLEFDFSISNDNFLKDATISKVYGDMWATLPQNYDGLFKNSGYNPRSNSSLNLNSPSKIAKNMINQIQQQEGEKDQNLHNKLQLNILDNQNQNYSLDKNTIQSNKFHFTEKIIKSRSFNLNQIFFGVSKQILLEISIPQQTEPSSPNKNKNLIQTDDNQFDSKNFKSFSEYIKNQVIGTGKLKVRDVNGSIIEKSAYLEMIILDENEELQESQNHRNEDVEINYLRVQCAQALQDAMNSALKNEYNESQQIINKALKQISESTQQIQNVLSNLQKDLEECSDALNKKLTQQLSSNPNSQSQLSYSSSHSTQDQKDNEQEKAHNIRRAFLCKSRAYMEQKSVMINLDEYQNNIQKNIKKQIEIQNQKKTFSAEEEEKEKEHDKPVVKAKKILIPLQRKKFSSMNVGINEISSIDEQK